MSTLSEFIWTERGQYGGKDNNRFAFSLEQVSRYYEFLYIICDRYETASQDFLSNSRAKMEEARQRSGQPFTSEQQELYRRGVQVTTILHLEVESFYLFAKVLLDKVAHFIADYFGKLRGVSLRSHDKWAKHYNEFTSAKGLNVPNSLSVSLVFLKEHVSDYRDKEIAHLNNPRSMMGTFFDGKGATTIVRTQLYPNERDRQVESKELPELMAAIDAYLSDITSLVSENRDKSRYERVQNSAKRVEAGHQCNIKDSKSRNL